MTAKFKEHAGHPEKKGKDEKKVMKEISKGSNSSQDGNVMQSAKGIAIDGTSSSSITTQGEYEQTSQSMPELSVEPSIMGQIESASLHSDASRKRVKMKDIVSSQREANEKDLAESTNQNLNVRGNGDIRTRSEGDLKTVEEEDVSADREKEIESRGKQAAKSSNEVNNETSDQRRLANSSKSWDSSTDIREQSTIRKQNSACDACRSRKVRCNRIVGESRCAHCKSKGIDCTAQFLQSAAISGKRSAKKVLPRQIATEEIGKDNHALVVQNGTMDHLLKYLVLHEVEYANVVKGLSYATAKKRTPQQPISTAESRLFQSSIRQNFVNDLIETFFAIVHTRYPVIDAVDFRNRFDSPTVENGGPPSDVLVAVVLAWGAKFSEHPIILSDRREAIHELTPLQRTKREAATNSSSTAEVAIANPVQFENKGKSRLSGLIVGRSRIAEDLVVKAQEVLDRNKVHRIATMDNIRAALIVEALFWKPAYNPNEDVTSNQGGKRAQIRPGLYIAQGNWVTSAIWHLKKLQIHHRESIDGILDPMQRTLIAMSWWLACMMDAHMCAFYRRKPLLSIDDYTTEAPAPPPAPEQQGPHPLGAENAYRVWINSAKDQVEMMRMACHTLWTPKVMREGVSASKLETLATMAVAWRDQHLNYVGAPNPSWPPTWNFADAVTACSTDMNYHIIWILMWEALDEFGIAELNNFDSSSSYNIKNLQITGGSGSSSSADTQRSSSAFVEMDQQIEIKNLQSRIVEEAKIAALRTANLSQVLCDNGYLRLEPGIMKWTMNEAGYCLTRFKRREVLYIIDALRQYGQAFEECYEQANELEKVASEYIRFDPMPSTRSAMAASVSTMIPSGVPSYTEEYVPKSSYSTGTSSSFSYPHQSTGQAQQVAASSSSSSYTPYSYKSKSEPFSTSSQTSFGGQANSRITSANDRDQQSSEMYHHQYRPQHQAQQLSHVPPHLYPIQQQQQQQLQQQHPHPHPHQSQQYSSSPSSYSAAKWFQSRRRLSSDYYQ